jgi:hypothetical protein
MSIQPRPPADRPSVGRPHKGHRHVTTVRIPHEMWVRLGAESKRSGVSRGDIVLHHLAQAWGAEHLDPAPDLEEKLGGDDQQLTMTA